MKEKYIETVLGEICVAIDEQDAELPPVIFMHGVFLDKTLWHDYPAKESENTRIYIDMPVHGKSSNVGHDWSMDDCVTMLIQVMDTLGVKTSFLIGHSWGSMTALRAAIKYPGRFKALGLFNMPYRKTTGLRKLGFILQKMMLVFPGFYAKQAAKSLYSKHFLEARPELSIDMQNRLTRRSAIELARVIDGVILNPGDATGLIRKLTIPIVSVIGEEDYVGQSADLNSLIVDGGHISPHESPRDTEAAINKVISLGI